MSESSSAPAVSVDGWSVGHVGHLGIQLFCDEFNASFDTHNLNLLFDFVEDGEDGEVRALDGRIIEVRITDEGIVLAARGDESLPNGIRLDARTLKAMGIEEYEEEQKEQEGEPESGFEPLPTDDTMQSKFEPLEEGVKRAYRRVGKKIKRGFRVTSGFRKGRVLSSAKAAYRPRKKASTRSKLRIAAKRKRAVRLLKGKMTRRKPTSIRLARMNKILR